TWVRRKRGAAPGASAHRAAHHRRRAQGRKAAPGRFHRAVDVDATTGVFDDAHGKSLAGAILGGEAYAEIECKAGKKDARQTAFAQVAGKPGGRRAVVFTESGVGIDRRAEPLAQDQCRVRDLQIIAEPGAGRAL